MDLHCHRPSGSAAVIAAFVGFMGQGRGVSCMCVLGDRGVFVQSHTPQVEIKACDVRNVFKCVPATTV